MCKIQRAHTSSLVRETDKHTHYGVFIYKTQENIDWVGDGYPKNSDGNYK